MRKKTERKKQGLFDSLERYNINKNRDIVPTSVDVTLFFLIGILAVLFGDSANGSVYCIGAEAAAIISAGISAASTLGQGIMASAKKRGTTRMMKVSKEMANFNNDLAIKNWRLQNEYDSPAAQMQRYREAGLNPNLIYGQQNTGGTIQTGQATTDPEALTRNSDRHAKAFGAVADSVSRYFDVIQRNKNINNTEASTNAILTEAELKKLQAEHQSIENKYFDDMMSHQLEGMVTSNAQRALDLELDRQFRARERIWSLEEKKAHVDDMNASAAQKREMTSEIAWHKKEIEQIIDESKARVYSLVNGVELGYGNLALGHRNAAVAERNATVAERNATSRENEVSYNQFNQNRNYNFEVQKFEQSVRNNMMNAVLNTMVPSGNIGNFYKIHNIMPWGRSNQQDIVNTIYQGYTGKKR